MLSFNERGFTELTLVATADQRKHSNKRHTLQCCRRDVTMRERKRGKAGRTAACGIIFGG